MNGSGSVSVVGIPSTTPAAIVHSGHYFDFMEQNDKGLQCNCTTHGYSRRRTKSTLGILTVKGLAPGWYAGFTE